MTLKNLLGISLDTIPPDKALVSKLLAAAQRNVADAQLRGLSAENRFDAAYKAIMQAAMVALHANGYRTLTSKPGHHQTAIQTLPTRVGQRAGPAGPCSGVDEGQPTRSALTAMMKQRLPGSCSRP